MKNWQQYVFIVLMVFISAIPVFSVNKAHVKTNKTGKEINQKHKIVKIQGVVVDYSTGEPIPGAVIKLDDAYLWAISDSDGKFILEKVQTSAYIIETSCLGYVTNSMSVKITNDIEKLKIRLHLNSLALDAVVVTAQTVKDNINTTRSIGKNALNHLQLSNMTEISSLLPGGKTINSDLTKDNILDIRAGDVKSGNSAFGTAVEVDGVRLGGNAAFGGLSGMGARALQVGNIQSIDVITGVPSAEYGDLNSGIVKVTTKKGRTPLDVVFAINPRTYETSISKGIDLGNRAGVLNFSAEWAKASSKLSSPYTSYTRRGFTIDYSNIFAKRLRLEAGLSGNIGGMNSKNDPDVISNEFVKERDNILTPHFKLMWLLNKEWITNLSLKGAIYFHDKKSHEHKYYSYATQQPSVHAEEEGYFIASKLPLSYYSDDMNDSKELDYSASIKYTWLKHFGQSKNLLKAGVQWKANGNVGDGEYALNSELAANGYRPRPYADYPYMHNLSFYVEDNLTFNIGKTRLNLRPGVRFENVFIEDSEYKKTRTISPRFNAKWQLSRKFSIRGGWGVTEKLPGFYILFPRQEYRDIMTAGFSYGNQGDATYVYYTQPYKMQHNEELKWQKNINSELGVDFELWKTKISFVGYYNRTLSPYEYKNIYTPFSYNIMTLPDNYEIPDDVKISVDSQTGDILLTDEGFSTPTELKVKDETFAMSRMQSNGSTVKRAGLELVMDFPEIKPIRTSLRLDAAYTYSHFVNNNLNAYYPNGLSHTSLPNRSYQYVGIYAGSNKVVNGKRSNSLNANLTSITHIPEARLIITCRLEASLFRRFRNLSEYNGKEYAYNVAGLTSRPGEGSIYDGDSYTAIRPVYYMDLQGEVHPFTDAEASDTQFSSLIMRSNNAYTFAQDGYDPYMSANLSVTKEAGDHVSISFFANNFTNSRKFVKSKATGLRALFTPKFYYGLTCRVKF